MRQCMVVHLVLAAAFIAIGCASIDTVVFQEIVLDYYVENTVCCYAQN